MNDADRIREALNVLRSSEHEHTYLGASAAIADLDRLVNERDGATFLKDCAENALRKEQLARGAAEAALRDAQTERDRWRAVACNVKDGTAAAEAQVQQLKDAITEYLSSETAGGDPIGPQWYIDCNERTKGKHYPGKARLARAALADIRQCYDNVHVFADIGDDCQCGKETWPSPSFPDKETP